MHDQHGLLISAPPVALPIPVRHTGEWHSFAHMGPASPISVPAPSVAKTRHLRHALTESPPAPWPVLSSTPSSARVGPARYIEEQHGVSSAQHGVPSTLAQHGVPSTHFGHVRRGILPGMESGPKIELFDFTRLGQAHPSQSLGAAHGFGPIQ